MSTYDCEDTKNRQRMMKRRCFCDTELKGRDSMTKAALLGEEIGVFREGREIRITTKRDCESKGAVKGVLNVGGLCCKAKKKRNLKDEQDKVSNGGVIGVCRKGRKIRNDVKI